MPNEPIKCPNSYSGLKCEGELWWGQEHLEDMQGNDFNIGAHHCRECGYSGPSFTDRLLNEKTIEQQSRAHHVEQNRLLEIGQLGQLLAMAKRMHTKSWKAFQKLMETESSSCDRRSHAGRACIKWGSLRSQYEHQLCREASGEETQGGES